MAIIGSSSITSTSVVQNCQVAQIGKDILPEQDIAQDGNIAQDGDGQVRSRETRSATVRRAQEDCQIAAQQREDKADRDLTLLQFDA
jgi:hypothetical protein